jgi:hypothetical protein
VSEVGPVPEISRFFGIVIQMYLDDHQPPHFHARYAGREVAIAIETHEVLVGRLPPRALAMVTEWGAMHVDELREDWHRSKTGQPLSKIDPLR